MNFAQPVRLVLLEPRELLCAALASLLTHRPGIVLLGATGDAAHAARLATLEDADVVLIGADRYRDQLPDIIFKITETRSQLRVLLLASRDDRELSAHALEAGAHGIVFDAQSPDLLIRAIIGVHQGETWIDRRTSERLLLQLVRNRAAGLAPGIRALTIRERELIESVGKGLANKRIADSLCISEATVRNHLTSIFKKLELRSRSELMVYAYRHRLADVPAWTQRPESNANISGQL